MEYEQFQEITKQWGVNWDWDQPSTEEILGIYIEAASADQFRNSSADKRDWLARIDCLRREVNLFPEPGNLESCYLEAAKTSYAVQGKLEEMQIQWLQGMLQDATPKSE